MYIQQESKEAVQVGYVVVEVAELACNLLHELKLHILPVEQKRSPRDERQENSPSPPPTQSRRQSDIEEEDLSAVSEDEESSLGIFHMLVQKVYKKGKGILSYHGNPISSIPLRLKEGDLVFFSDPILLTPIGRPSKSEVQLLYENVIVSNISAVATCGDHREGSWEISSFIDGSNVRRNIFLSHSSATLHVFAARQRRSAKVV